MAEENTERFEGPVSEAPVEAPVSSGKTEVDAPDADEVREPQAVVNQGEVAAQVVQPREPDSDVVPVHETHVSVDEVITDPSDPKAVQVPEPDAAAGVLPIHALARPTVEAQLAAAADSDE